MKVGDVVFISGTSTGIRDGYYELMEETHQGTRFKVKAKLVKFRHFPYFRTVKKASISQASIARHSIDEIDENHIRYLEDTLTLIRGFNVNRP